MPQPFLSAGGVAVITGGASGIGLAAARRFAERGMKVFLADIDGNALADAEAAVAGLSGAEAVTSRVVDVAAPAEVEALADAAFARFGRVDLLMNNAATRVAGGEREDLDEWRRTMDVNFWSAVHGEHAFLDRMAASGARAAIVNTGSKQGITNPPGNLIYNVTKSALKTYTEGLQHRLRTTEGCAVTAHLLIPGFTTTGRREHKPGAWLPVQVVDFMIEALERGDFYILCPDGEVTPEMDRKRMLWGVGDIIENRPPLSRWHPDWTDAFDKA